MLAIGYSVFEWSSFSSIPEEQNRVQLAEESVQSASQNFTSFMFDFTNQTTLFKEFVMNHIEQEGSLPIIDNELQNNYDFWGAIIYKEQKALLWSGFAPTEYFGELLDNDQPLFVSIGIENNVTFLYAIIPFFLDGENGAERYDIYTRVKISQENILTIGVDLEINPSSIFTDQDDYPVSFNFNDLNQPDEIASVILSTATSDSVGKVFALENTFEEYHQLKKQKVEFWRGVFLFIFLLIIGGLVISFSKTIGGWRGLGVQLVSFLIVWILIKTVYPLIDVEGRNLSYLTNIFLVEYIVNSFFSFLVAFSFTSFLLKRSKAIPKRSSESQISKIILLSALLGIGLAVILFKFLSDTSSVISNSDISVLDLELIPELSTLLFYLSSTTLFTSILVLFTTSFWYLFKKLETTLWQVILALFVGFFGVLGFGKTTFLSDSSLNWIIAISTLFFFISLLFAIYLLKKAPAFLYSSKLRLLIFISYLGVCFTYIAFVDGNTVRQDQRMLQIATDFSIDEELEIRNITRILLDSVSIKLSQNSTAVYDEPLFDQIVQNTIQDDWLEYTISIQLINEVGNRFADYTTSLSPPQWSTAFRIEELEFPFEDEQIRRNNLRPILRTRPLSTLNSSYSSFIRGWIPLFENPTSNKRVAWLLCSVYRELPQLDRPLRAVVKSESKTISGDTFTSTEYEEGISSRTAITGVPLKIEVPSVLSSELIEKVLRDSIRTSSSIYNNETIKELFLKKGNGNIVRVATKLGGIKQHVFSILRFFFVLVIFGICAMGVFSWREHWKVLGSARRFKDRLIDRFLLASLVCLLALVGASYFVLESQNDLDVQERLFDRLNNLTSSLESDLSTTFNSTTELQKITSILDVDAALYKNGVLVNSTTSQIFSQNVLPKTVPWSIYESIYSNNSNKELSKIELDSQEMLIGYRPWLDDNNQIIGIVAIPTFQKAPKFYDRLLSTTSYLLAFFTLIFGFLMLVVGFISNQLTAPLEEIADGLKRVSDGDLEATLPVKSSDEIGMLSKAYNRMAHHLKIVQKELAETEREAAWKEMAQQVAHEIKNPLTPMKLNLQHLERQIQGDDQSLEILKPKISKIAVNMIEQIDSLNKIASDFSKFAKPIEQELAPISLNDLVSSVAEMYESDDSFVLVKDFSKKPLPILGAREELRRVLVNLIKNSKEALQKNGSITIRTFTDPTFTNAFIAIIDNGEGIKFQDQENIFVPNFSTKSSGTGLGLAITKKIVEEHNGEISFISTLDQGTSFTIRIPLYRE